MQVLKNPWFVRFARKDKDFRGRPLRSVARAELGLVDADLGGGVVKQRVARPGAGRSGGYRSVILYRRGERAVFVFGFAKSDIDNIDQKDAARLKALAELTLGFSELEITTLVEAGKLVEVVCDD